MMTDITIAISGFAAGLLTALVIWQHRDAILDRLHGWPTDVETRTACEGRMASELSKAQWTNRHGLWYAPGSDEPMTIDVAYAEWQRWNVLQSDEYWQMTKRNGVPR